ncbi:MAG TPA: transposase [Chloroflexota bacterium]|nr:transposase [Chloroflexota bacterium]
MNGRGRATNQRRSIRLRGHDYSQPGAYFVTICTLDGRSLLWETAVGQSGLSPCGKIALQCWENIPKHFPLLSLDAYVVMPNHVHGILMISECEPSSPSGGEISPRLSFSGSRRGSIAAIVGAYKSAVSRQTRGLPCAETGGFWQRGYYERIIRDEAELGRVREYIANNPISWADDPENPLSGKGGMG